MITCILYLATETIVEKTGVSILSIVEGANEERFHSFILKTVM